MRPDLVVHLATKGDDEGCQHLPEHLMATASSVACTF